MSRNEGDLVLVLMIHCHELQDQDGATHGCRQEPESLMSIPSVWHISLVLKVLQVDGQSPQSGRQNVDDVPEDRFFGSVPIIYQVLHAHS